MKVLVAKIIALVALFVATFIFGAVPYKFSATSNERRLRLVSLASCFAGGVFLATSFLHLLPDVRESFEEAFHHDPPSYPVTEAVVIAGFFLVLVFEQLVLVFHQPGERAKCEAGNVPPHGCHRDNTCNRREDEDESSVIKVTGYGSTPDLEQNGGSRRAESSRMLDSQRSQLSQGDDAHDERTALLTGRSSLEKREDQTPASVRSLLLLAALSLHSLFEGLAMGLQDTTESVFEVFIAVILHKSILAFSLGVRYVRSGSSLARLLCAVLVFAIMSPVGVSIGIIITETSGDDESAQRQLATAILQGIATGTFVFVTFLEILAHELQENRSAGRAHQLLKVAMCLFGAAAMAGVQFADTGHEH